jgi:hypothetical protein
VGAALAADDDAALPAAALAEADEAPVCPVLTLDFTPPDCCTFWALDTLELEDDAELLPVGHMMGAPGWMPPPELPPMPSAMVPQL